METAGARQNSAAQAVSAIHLRGLEKRFKRRRRGKELLMPWRKPAPIEALRGVDLEVAPGELVALIGPNGAGKTTLLKIVATLVLPDAGTCEVAGVDVARDPHRARAQLGYVLTDERSFFWRLSVHENLLFFANLQGMFGKVAAQRIEILAAMLGLQDLQKRDFADLSLGQKQRVAIARGLLADPPVVLFDEATRSLDPGRAERVRRVVREVLVERGKKAVLFATHDLAEARALADRVVLMAEGKIVQDGPYEAIEPKILELFRQESRAEDEALYRLFPDLAPATLLKPGVRNE